MERELGGASRDLISGTQAPVCQRSAKHSGVGRTSVVKCRSAKGLAGEQDFPLTSGEWLAGERQKQAVGIGESWVQIADGGTGSRPRS